MKMRQVGRKNIQGEKHRLKSVVIVFFLVTAAYTLHDPILFGKSFAITSLYNYPPWDSLIGKKDVPDNNAGTDGVFTFYPRKVLAKRALKNGEIPFWEPYNLAGAPFMADPHTALLYPMNVLHIILPPPIAFKMIALFQLFLAGILMFGFLREIGLGVEAALLGGFLFQVNTFTITHIINPTNVDSAIWLPAMLWIIERNVHGKDPLIRSIPLLAGAVSLTVLGGFPPIIVFSLYCIGAYTIVAVISALSKKERRKARNILLLTVGGFLLAFLLTSLQTFQTLELAHFSGRKTNSLRWFKSIFMPPEAFITYLIPDFFGTATRSWIGAFSDGIKGGVDGAFWRNSYQENAGYMGILPILLVFVGISFRIKERPFRFFMFTGLTAILLTSGSFLFFLAFYILPGFRFSRICRIVYLYSASVAIMAAYGFNYIMENSDNRKLKTLFMRVVVLGGVTGAVTLLILNPVYFHPQTVLHNLEKTGKGLFPVNGISNSSRIDTWSFAWRRILWNYDGWFSSIARFWVLLIVPSFVVLLFLSGKINRKLFTGSVFYIVFIDLMMFTSGFLTFQPVMYPADLPQPIEVLKKDKSIFRIARYGEFREVMPPNSTLVYGIDDLQGSNALLVDRFGKLTELIDPAMYIGNKKVISISTPEALSSPLLDLMNVKYIISTHFLPDQPGREKNTTRMRRIYTGDMNIYQNTDVLPRAFIAHESITAEDDNDALALLRSGKLDLSRVVVLSAPSPFEFNDQEDEGIDSKVDSGGQTEKSSSVEITKYDLNEVDIRARTKSNCFLVLSDLHYPGWKCLVDGRETRIYRADYAFRCVPLKPGLHEIRYYYKPTYLIPGLIVSLVGFMIFAVMMVVSFIKRGESDNGMLLQKG